MASTNLPKTTFAQHAIHPKRFVRDGLRFEPLPLQVAVKVHRLGEFNERFACQIGSDRLDETVEQISVGAIVQLLAFDEQRFRFGNQADAFSLFWVS